MTTTRQTPWDEVIDIAASVHAQERSITLRSVSLVGELDRGHAALEMGISTEQLARRIGLSRSMYFKRAQAARVIRSYPEVVAMVESGQTEISLVAAIATKVTPANAEVLLDGIRNKTKREVELLLSVVTPDGRILDREPEVEVRAVLSKSQAAKLDRAREVLSHGGKVPTNAEVLVQAIGDLLAKRDPLLAAERARRREAKRAATQEAAGLGAKQVDTSESAPGHGYGDKSQPKRTPTPAAVRHETALRDQGQCVERLADGSRCPERFNLERDHDRPVCRGGKNTVDNEHHRCRGHNQQRARQQLGEKYLVTWEESRARAANRPPAPPPHLSLEPHGENPAPR